MSLIIDNIRKSYGPKEVLKGISLVFEKGKAYGIAGENGAGKTTLFRSIAGLETCSGKVQSEFETIKNNLGFLPTNPKFMSRITGWEYLKLFTLARGIKDDNFQERNIFELPLNEYAEHYSTGMKKKLAIMAILFQKNELFILDEPFNGVDIQSNMIINSIIHELKSLGKTILISSHIFSTLRETCDEIHLLRDGKIVYSASPVDFDSLEDNMKSHTLSNKIEMLKLS